ncbi:hypothetical protein MYE70_04190 [Marinobacter alexandrii]|jgi:hypothetical protein|uniref:hypothetical protein n=1 Tax=Marinobacter TaxID=2742 RepID=UPI00110994A3|nr:MULTISPECIES: hypothetical protein [Marinobacter]MCK2148256.1 hypothetical protein [Marinobacter alexandrii]
MRNLTRMLAVTGLSLFALFAVAGDEMKHDDGMMSDDTMEQDMSEKGMEKDDMADDMGHGMKDDAMDAKGMDDTMEKDMGDMSMDEETMDHKDTME